MHIHHPVSGHWLERNSCLHILPAALCMSTESLQRMMCSSAWTPSVLAALMCQVIPWHVPLKKRRLKSPLMFSQLSMLQFNFKIFCPPSWTSSRSLQHRMFFICLNNLTWFRVLSHSSAKLHLFACSPGLWPESAPAARHVRAWCHQAGGNPPSRRETPPPRAAVSNEVSSTPSRRHRRLHQWGKNTLAEYSY